ncbi:Phosphotransferase enzyme family protein [Micromonospora pattaloongensis]|uniref:Phosphotransferase enzyme family protein n=1 Tax=Micromonospora pattaloongensis TaxID=405436 RepID=A0A1H3RKS0_9ACTN|nr:phosphotransferase [Micromonospora pattaloongensis]SDZ26307.1 Phosphotransferase enzyme family protein [Micromonospora pattaloongensis]
MSASPVSPVPYGATAVRPDWADLSEALRAAVAGRLGAPVTGAVTAGGGFTRGFAAVLTTGAGDRVFVKAASRVDQPHLADWYAREAAITAVLPGAVPAPRPRWTLTAAGHVVVCFDAIHGHVPGLPWDRRELDAALSAWATAADALREPPPGLLAVGLPALADLLRADLSWWNEIAAGRHPLPEVPPHAAARLTELATLEAALPAYCVGGGAIHGDLRLDNVLVDRAGAAWICDWTWPCLGPAWFDTATLLVTAHASGLDADALFAAHPTARHAPPDALDGALAALSGYWLTAAMSGPTDASPAVRSHQRWSGETALAWLCARRGWR